MTLTDTPTIAAEPATPASRSRRAILAASLGGVAATVAEVLCRPSAADAAAGSSLTIGSSTNDAGTSNTILTTTSSVVAFELLQHGPGTALMGYVTPTSGTTRGVYGRTDSPNGFGVQARNAGAAGTGAAVQAIGVNNIGLDVSTDNGSTAAVHAVNNGSGGIGVYGISGSGAALNGTSSSGIGVYGGSSSWIGVYGHSASYYAGFFDGPLYATSANAAIKAFRIDHPLDPAGKVLMHSCVESNERKLVYDGVVTTDEQGHATVELPGYFDALNRDLRYQLTPLADARAWVQSEVAGNRFSIATNEPGTKVCWQVTGVRQDAYAAAHPLVVESPKTGREQGRYLNPLEHGQPERLGVDFELRQRAQPGA
jgi:hypothetical protein